jgi:hypothetical protein
MAADVAQVLSRCGDDAPDNVTMYGCAALLHGHYTALERLFQSVARDFNGEPPASPDWHRRLLVAASSEREGRRPAVVSTETAAALDRYLRFRHLFRNLYVFRLEWSELEPLLRRLEPVHALVDADLARFDAFLAALIDASS